MTHRLNSLHLIIDLPIVDTFTLVSTSLLRNEVSKPNESHFYRNCFAALGAQHGSIDQASNAKSEQ